MFPEQRQDFNHQAGLSATAPTYDSDNLHTRNPTNTLSPTTVHPFHADNYKSRVLCEFGRLDASAQADKARDPNLKGQKAVSVVPTFNRRKYLIQVADGDLDIVPTMKFNNLPEGVQYAKSQGMDVAGALRKI